MACHKTNFLPTKAKLFHPLMSHWLFIKQTHQQVGKTVSKATHDTGDPQIEDKNVSADKLIGKSEIFLQRADSQPNSASEADKLGIKTRIWRLWLLLRHLEHALHSCRTAHFIQACVTHVLCL